MEVLETDPVLGLDFSDRDVLSRAIDTMSPGVNVGFSEKLDGQLLSGTDQYIQIENDENAYSIVDIETIDQYDEEIVTQPTFDEGASNFVEVVEEQTIDILSSAGEIIEEQLINMSGSPGEVIEEEIINITGSTGEVIEEQIIDMQIPCSSEEVVEELAVHMEIPNTTEEIIEEPVINMVVPSMVKEQVIDEISDKALEIEMTNKINELSSSHEMGIHIDPIQTVIPSPSHFNNQPFDALPENTVSDTQGIVAEDMSSLFEQFESQEEWCEPTTIAVTSTQTSLNHSCDSVKTTASFNKNILQLHNPQHAAAPNHSNMNSCSRASNINSSVVKPSVPVVLVKNGSMNKLVLLPSKLDNQSKHSAGLVSLLNPAKAGVSLLNKTYSAQVGKPEARTKKLGSSNVIAVTPLSAQNITTEKPIIKRLSTKVLPASNATTISYQSNSDNLMGGAGPIYSMEVVSQPLVQENCDIDQVPEVKTEVEVGGEEEVSTTAPEPLICSDTPTIKTEPVDICDMKNGNESPHSTWRSPESRDQSKSNPDVLNKIPGYMCVLTEGDSSLRLDDTAATAASSILKNELACSASVNKDSSPVKESSDTLLQYSRVPDYCSTFTSSARYTEKVIDSHKRNGKHKKGSSRCGHRHKKSSRHRKSKRRSRTAVYSSSLSDSSDDEVLVCRRQRHSSTSSSLTESDSCSSSSGDSSSSGRSGSKYKCRRNRSPVRHKSRRCRRRYSHKSHQRCRRNHRHKHSRSYSRSDTSRSRSRDRKTRHRHRSRSRSAYERSVSPLENEKKAAHEKAMAERRVMYVGGISDNHTPSDLRERFGVFGEIETTSVHFRIRSDNYGFVTYLSPTDAQKAITNGNKVPGPTYNLCFGGRRMFCKTDYADLDGCTAVKEEWALHEIKREEPADDFDALLRQTLKMKNVKS